MDGFASLANAYHTPKSDAQQKYVQERLAAHAEQRKQRASEPDLNTHLERSLSGPSIASARLHRPDTNYGEMDQPRRATTSSSTSSSSEVAHQSLLSNPFELRYGRRYLREVPYPLPVDLAEMQRQNLRTLICCTAFGRAVCSPYVKKSAPKRVLELGCGSAYWSAMCHDDFCTLGYKNVAFTGLDIAPLAPDLKKQGINWDFVQHDLRRLPLPFEDETFDLVMVKDMSMVVQDGKASDKFLDESIRILRAEGTLEFWESDHVLRSLSPHVSPPSKQRSEQEDAKRTATFPISPGTPFVPARNKFLRQANTWIQKAMDKRNLLASPCTRIAPMLYQESSSLTNFGSRRIAIPLGELRWERDQPDDSGRHHSGIRDFVIAEGKGKALSKDLTKDQAALRHTALLTVLQKIESLEPLLKEVSGKNSEEWGHWWSQMMAELLDPSKAVAASTGECLEVGAWWATKLTRED